jgi:hypothetical protein
LQHEEEEGDIAAEEARNRGETAGARRGKRGGEEDAEGRRKRRREEGDGGVEGEGVSNITRDHYTRAQALPCLPVGKRTRKKRKR